MVETSSDKGKIERQSYISGKVAAIFFENPTNFYKVMLIKIEETNTIFEEKEIVVTGTFGQIQEEEVYRFTGEIIEHPRYGKQFQVTTYQQEKPTTKNGAVAYLASDKFPGIGKKTAQAIIDALGEQAIDLIAQDPSCLHQVTGINDKKRNVIVETIQLNHGMEQVIIGLSRYGFGSQLSFAIYQTYKNEALDIIQENPYQLVEDIEGIGFKKADNIAEQLGYQADSSARIQAALIHELLSSSLSNGDTFVEAEKLLHRTIQTLESSRPFEIAPEKVADEVIRLVDQTKIMQEGTHLYEKSLYFSEWGIATAVQRLLTLEKKLRYQEKEVDKTIRLLEKKFDIQYGESQIEAMKAAIQSPLFILTGGPGTGKTTIINGIVSLFAELNGLSLDPKEYHQEMFPILLAAPTGRAAKRMNEMTGLPASTIHRLLGLSGREKNSNITPKELEGGLLVIDEMSMVDTWLANTLFKSIPTNMQVILVGDKDQLASVGPGQVLHDFLNVEDIPKKELIEIYRQTNESTIIPLAHQIKQGSLPKDFTRNTVDRSFFASDAYHIEGIIRQVVTRAKEKGFSPQEVQVLAPMYRGVAGIDALNKMIQEIFNPNPYGKRKEVKWNETVYRIGDKVLQLVNSPEINVFNGDMGVITGIMLAKESEDKVDELIIEFDNGEVNYKRNEWNKITMAYCCSIHKAQGSEFKMVILPMVHQYHRMLQRSLLYTAVTRSKEILILLGEQQAFKECIENQVMERKTTLLKRIVTVEDLSLQKRSQLEDYENAVIEETRNSFQDPSIPAQKKTSLDQEKLATQENLAPLSLATDYAEPEPQGQLEFEIEKNILTKQMVEMAEIDPMIGMSNITPHKFMASNNQMIN